MATLVKADALQASDAERSALVTYLGNQGVQSAQGQFVPVPGAAGQWYMLGSLEDLVLAAEAIKTLSP